jgi:hypothetical protein
MNIVGIERGRRLRDDSAAVEDFLRNDLYAGRGFWQVTAEPLLYSCTFLLVSALSAFSIRERYANYRCFGSRRL